jgi:hypothetical protein
MENIKAQVKRFVELKKEYNNKSSRTKSKADVLLPEYWDGYNYAVEMMNAIRVHAERNFFPEHLFKAKAPNQTDEEIKLAKAIFKNPTQTVFIDYINTVSRVNNDANYTLEFRDKEEQMMAQYIKYVTEDLPVYGSVEAFQDDILQTIKAIDPNGIVVLMPSYDVVRDELGNPIVQEDSVTIDDTTIKVKPIYYSVDKIVAQNEDVFYMVVMDEKSEVEEGSKKVREGIVLLFMDSTGFYKIYQVGKKSEMNFSEPVQFYPTNFEYVPAIKLMGVPKLIPGTTRMVYNSPFSYVIDVLDMALLDNSNLQISKYKCVFPYVVSLAQPCEFERDGQKCNRGEIFDMASERNISCPSCNGSGLKSRITPSGQLLINPKSSISEGDQQLPDYIKYVSPSTETVKFLDEQIEKNEKKARRILHLPDADSSATGNEGKTATGSLSKQKALVSLIQPISDQTFDIVQFIYDTIGVMMFGQNYKGVDIGRPVNYDIMTSEDYIYAIAEAQRVGVAPFVIYTLINQYIRSMFVTSKEATAAYELLMSTDYVVTLSVEDVSLAVANGTIDKWQELIHISGIQLIQELVGVNENFFQQDFKVQMDQLIAKAKERLPVIENQRPEIFD